MEIDDLPRILIHQVGMWLYDGIKDRFGRYTGQPTDQTTVDQQVELPVELDRRYTKLLLVYQTEHLPEAQVRLWRRAQEREQAWKCSRPGKADAPQLLLARDCHRVGHGRPSTNAVLPHNRNSLRATCRTSLAAVARSTAPDMTPRLAHHRSRACSDHAGTGVQ